MRLMNFGKGVRCFAVALLLLLNCVGVFATPACPIVTGAFQLANGATIDNSSTGWSINSVPGAVYFAVLSNRIKAEDLGGVGVWTSKVFSVAGYSSFQAAVKITAEGDQNSSEYVRIYYRIDGGSEVLMNQGTGNFGTIDFTSGVLTGNNIQLIVRIYNYNNGGSQTSKYYIEQYRVFKEAGPCGNSISVSATSSNSGQLTCSSPSVTLSASSTASGVTYSWTGPNSFSSTSQNPVVSTAGTYTVVGVNSTSTGSATVTVTANNSLPNLTATGGTLSCGSSVTLNASSTTSSVTYNWTGPGSFTSSAQNPVVSTAGSYTVTVTNPSNGCTAMQTVSVTSGTATPSSFWLEDFALADGATNDTGATSWTSSTTGSGTFSVQSGAFKTSFVAGNTAEGVWTSGVVDISSRGAVTVSVDLKSETASSSDALENTDYINVYYKLNNGAETLIFGDVAGLNGTTNGTQTAIATSASLTGNTLQIVIRVKNSDPTERYYFDNIKMTGLSSSVTLSASLTGSVTCTSSAQISLATSGTVSSYAWTGPNGFTSTAQNPTVTAGGTYSVVGTLAGGCTVSTSIIVPENKTVPDLTATGGALSCATSFTLNASSSVSGATYSWTGPNSFTNTSKNPTVSTAGTYAVTVTNPANGCTASQSVQVTGSTAVTLWLEDFTLGNGTTSDTGTTSWTSQTTAGTFAVLNNEFQATNITNASGSEAVWTSGVINITGKTNVAISLDQRSAVASGSSMDNSGTDLDYFRVYYKLNNGAEVLLNEKIASINGNSTTYTNVSGGSLSGTSLQIILRVRATGNNTEFYYFDNAKVTGIDQSAINASATVSGVLSCTTSSVTVSGSSSSSGVTYAWTGPNGFAASTQNISVSTAGTYTLVVSNGGGCSASSIVNVTQDIASPGATASVNGSITCTTASVTLSGSSSTSGVTYRWTGPSSFTSTSQNPTVSTAGTYTLTATNPMNGCTSTASVNAIVNTANTSTIWLEDFALGNGSTSDAGSTSWTAQTTAGTASVSSNEFLITNITTATGSEAVWTSGVIDITGKTNVTISLDERSAVTGGAAMNTSGNVFDYLRSYYKINGGTEILFDEKLAGINNHSTTPTNVSIAGLSGTSLQIVIRGRATGNDEFYYVDNVKVVATGALTAGASASGTLSCATSSVVLSGTSNTSGVTYGWVGPNNFISTAQNPVVTAAGTYTLTVTNPVNGCTATASVTVTLNTANTSTIWLEDFTLSNGTTSDTGSTSWATQTTGGIFSVLNNEFVVTNLTSNTGSEGVWTSGVIDISNKTNVTISLDERSAVTGSGSLNNSGTLLDYVRVYYKLNGGAEVLFDERLGSINNQSTTPTAVSIAGLSGTSLQIVIRSRATANDEFYYLDNVKVVGTGSLIASASASGTLSCSTTAVVLSGTSNTSGVTYSWTGPNNFTSTSQNPSVINSGTYILTVTNPVNGCTANSNIAVTQDLSAPVAVTATSSAVLTCSTTTSSLTATTTSTGVTYLWTGPGTITNATSAVATVSAPGTYTLKVTKTSTGCFTTTTVDVTQDLSAPVAVTATSSAVLTCSTTTSSLTATTTSTGVTYLWTGPGTITNATSAVATVSAPGTYTLKVTKTSTGCFTTTTVNVTQDLSAPVAVTATSSAVLTCSITSTNLTATTTSTGVTYLWTGPGTITNATSAVATVSAPGTYTLKVTKTSTGCFTTTTVDVTQDLSAPVAVTATSNAVLTCSITSTNLTATTTSTGVTYLWTGPGTITNATSAVATVSAPGTYTLKVTKTSTGCFTTTTVDVTQDLSAPVAVTATSSAVLTCSITSTNLTATTTSTGVTYLWTGPGTITNATSAVATVSAPGTYTLKVTKTSTRCFTTTTVDVTQDLSAPVAVTATSSAGLTCSITSTNLTATTTSTGVTYLWTGPGTITNATSAVATVSAPGTYTLKVTKTSTGCFTTTTVDVTQDLSAPVAVTATSSAVLTCSITSTNLTATTTSTGVTYLWTGPGTITNATSAVATVSAPGTYTLKVTKTSTGCFTTTTVDVTQDLSAPVAVTATSSAVLTCSTTTSSLTATTTSTGVTYLWTGPGTITNATSAVATVSAPGTYTLKVTKTSTGCFTTTTVDVTQDLSAPVAVTATSSAVLTCSTTTSSLTATTTSTGVTYLWTGPGTITNATSAVATVSAPGTYTLKVTKTSTGCFTTTTVDVTQDLSAPVAVTATSSAVLTCSTTTSSLTATTTSTGVTYLWTGPGTITNATSAVATVSAPGTYTLKVTKTSTGCFTTTTVDVTQDVSVPNRNIVNTTGTLTLTCYINPLILTGTSTTPGATFRWTSTAGYLVNGAVASISTPGTYSLIAIGPNGCVSSSLNRTVGQSLIPPVASATATGSITCSTSSVTLNGASSGLPVTYSWTGPNGFTSVEQNPSVTAGGRYDLTITTPGGCTNTASVDVIEDKISPNATAGVSGPLTCATLFTTLLGGSAASVATYNWTGPVNFASTDQNPIVSGVGLYNLIVTNTENGCVSTATVDVTQDLSAPVAVTATSSAVLTCSTTTSSLTATTTSTGVTYLWTGPGTITNATSAVATVSAPGTYTLKVTKTSTGCFTTTTVDVTQDVSVPNRNIVNTTGTLTLTCYINPLILTGTSTTPGATFRWTSTAGYLVNGAVASISTPGTYSLIAIGPNGCVSSSLNRTVGQSLIPPVASATATGSITCSTSSVTLNGASSGLPVTYSWTGPNGFTSVEQNPSVTAGGRYDLTITTPGGCINTASVDVAENNEECLGFASTNDQSLITDEIDDNLFVSVYPNPIVNMGTLELTTSSSSTEMYATIELYSLIDVKVATLYTGTLVAENSNIIKFDANGLANGVYIYKITYANRVVNGRFIIAH